VTPEEALALAKTVADLYAQATADLLQIIARSTARGMDRPEWAGQQLAQILPLRLEAQRIVSRMQAASAVEVQALLREVYDAQAGAVGGSRVNNRTVVALAEDLMGRTSTLGPRVVRRTEDIYRNVMAEVVASGVTGVKDRRAVTAAALDRFAKAGIDGFTDSAGRNWNLESYAEMATRSALGRAHLAGTLDKYLAEGREYVIISDSPEECPTCRPYEGKVLSLGADIPPTDLGGLQYAGTLAAAIAKGLFHPNCTHRANVFIPGLTEPTDDTENPLGYEDRQRQRGLERGVRESKRRVAALRPIGDTPELQRQERLLKVRQQRLADFIRDNDRKPGSSRQRKQIPGGLPPKPKAKAGTRVAAGSPVSAALTIQTGVPALDVRMSNALAAIDRVHSDGRLPRLTVEDLPVSSSNLGAYARKGADSVSFKINPAGSWPELTFVHEAGHFLDHQGIGASGTMESAVVGGALADVMAAINASSAVRGLRGFKVDRTLDPVVARDITAYIGYLLKGPELWARAYAQWITLRSGDPVLRRQLEAAVNSGRGRGVMRQWDDDDFEAIADAIDEAVRRLGWLP